MHRLRTKARRITNSITSFNFQLYHLKRNDYVEYRLHRYFNALSFLFC
nr:MAG TPA: hypothetical protein [Bacteriophage sp.]